jgi:hypothetical protein
MTDLSNYYRIGWRQGAVLPPGLFSALHPIGRDLPEPTPDGLAIVVSQDCDINCPSLDVEPFAEVVWAKPVDKLDGNLTLGKNPRKIHFEALQRSREQTFETQIRWRYELDRRLLADQRPDASVALDEGVGLLLPRWLSKRLTRAAFPDSFNQRLFPSRRKIKKLLEEKGKRLSGIYLILEDEELPLDQDYQVILRATMLDVDYETSPMRTVSEAGLTGIVSMIRAQGGIDVKEWEIIPERDFSISDLKVYRRWDYDALSLSEPEESVFPTEA